MAGSFHFILLPVDCSQELAPNDSVELMVLKVGPCIEPERIGSEPFISPQLQPLRSALDFTVGRMLPSRGSYACEDQDA
jgi:hypothetical protein